LLFPLDEPSLLIQRKTRRLTLRTDIMRSHHRDRSAVTHDFPRSLPFILLPLPILRTAPPIPDIAPTIARNLLSGMRPFRLACNFLCCIFDCKNPSSKAISSSFVSTFARRFIAALSANPLVSPLPYRLCLPFATPLLCIRVSLSSGRNMAGMLG